MTVRLAVTLAFFAIGMLPTVIALSWKAIHLIKEKRRGQHRKAEEGTRDPEADFAVHPSHKAFLANYHTGSIAFAGYPSSSSRSGVIKVEGQADGLERVESDMPILAHRSALLCLDGTREYFGAVTRKSQRFGVDAEAVCTDPIEFFPYHRTRTHRAPAPSCECGFYALPTDLAPTYEAPGYVTLMVELSGTVIEHEKGYRAEHQRVIECQVGPCVYCGAEADLLVVKSFTMEQATCAAHKPVDEPGVVYLGIADLAALLPVPVTRAGCRKESG